MIKSILLYFLGYSVASCSLFFGILRYKNKRGRSKNVVIKKSILFGLLLACVLSITTFLIAKKNNEDLNSPVCDRDVENGCTIDLPDILNWKMYVEGFGGSLQYTVSVGKNQTVGQLQFIDNPTNLNPQIPTHMEFPKEESPYQISCDAKNLFFSGDVREFKDNELIGWFDQNDFGNYNCNMLWNKDECGLEILDKYGYVVFAVDYTPATEKIEFKGYYRKDDMIYIFDEEYYGTHDLKYAEKLISQIKPIFKHRGKNSTGVRLIEKSCD